MSLARVAHKVVIFGAVHEVLVKDVQAGTYLSRMGWPFLAAMK
jgi:hypothetical protein